MHVGVGKKMERLMEDAIKLKNLLPWIESDEDIINFMRKIPLDKNHLRNQLTLRYFLRKRDCRSNDFEKEIEDDAREIVIVMPDTSYKEIKEKLSILGNIPNRKEVILRQLLNKKRDLDKTLKEINVGTVKKRKTESSNDNFTLDSNESHTNINIKIRKVDGSLEVVSSISSQDKPGTSKSFNIPDEQIDGPSTSSTSVTSSASHSSNSSPDSTVPSNSEGHSSSNSSPDSTVPSNSEANDPCPEFTAILNDLFNSKSSPSTSKSVMPSRKIIVPSVSNNIGCANISNVNKPIEVDKVPLNEEAVTPQATTPLVTTSDISGENKTEEQPKFDLINFVKELSLASEYRIYQLCKQMGLNLKERPSESKLNYLLNQLLDDVVEIKSVGSSDSDSDPRDYNLDDGLPGVFPQPIYHPGNNERKNNPKTNSKEFKLKDPILTLQSQQPVAIADPFSAPKKVTSVRMGSSIIQPARFRPASPRENIIPAMPNIFLAALHDRTLRNDDVEPLPELDDEPLPLVPDHPFVEPSKTEEDMIIDESDVSNESINTALNLTINRNEPIMLPPIEPQAGPSNAGRQNKKVLDQNLVLRLIEMFPEACPQYIRKVCTGKQWVDLDDVVTVILSAPSYPKRPERVPSPPKEVDPEEQFEIIKELLPDADPTYLRMQCERFANDEKGLKEFINSAMEKKEYPTMKEYMRKQQLSAQQKQYTTEFNIENFIQLFPEPEKTFSDPKRSVKIESYSVHYLNTFFKNRYDRIHARIIQQVLIQKNFKVLDCETVFKRMVQQNDTMKSKRKHLSLPENLENIPLLQELAYLIHREEIKSFLLEKQKKEQEERVEAKECGLMETCQCCYDEEVMPKDTFTCPNGCKFCRECIQRSCEVAFGEGKTDFPCLAACPTEFTLQTLQNVLPPKMFSKLAQKKALAEIKAAGIEELETCPFCDFATIPNETDRIFRCLNPDCMKESCRMCKEPNHVPLKCEEVEKDQDVKARTYIENKMTEALLRKCWKCGTSFFKEEGCNKMTCSCGASMCYICQQPVKDYSHFNGIGGDKFNLCPLYSDTNLVNQQNVLGAAAAAKAEIDPAKLKTDPTVGITDHFKQRAKKLPREPHMEILQRANPHLVHRHGHRHRHRHHALQRQRYAEYLLQNLWNMQE